jgi:hypothetical protein
MEPRAELEPLVSAVRTSRNALLRLAAILFVATPAILIGGSAGRFDPAAYIGFASACGFFAILCSLFALPLAWPEQSAIVRAVRDCPERIERVYVIQTRVLAAGVELDTKYDLVVGLKGGSRCKLGVLGRDLGAVISCIRRQAPNADYSRA